MRKNQRHTASKTLDKIIWFEKWKHRRPDEHLWHFDKDSLVNFMERMGYIMVSCSNLEDTIRKNPHQEETNILTCVFKKLGILFHVLNCLQVYRLLATRGHYSIDIIVGFVVAIHVTNPAERLGLYFSSVKVRASAKTNLPSASSFFISYSLVITLFFFYQIIEIGITKTTKKAIVYPA